MTLISTNKTLSTKTATFIDAANISDNDLLAAAYQATGETPARCFGSHIRRVDDAAFVTVYTD